MTNEFNTIIESSLGGLGAGRTIAAVRVVDDTGGSAKVSPLQLRELVGIDHSLLTEQIVQGEFFTNPNGIKQQVYGRRVAMYSHETTGLVSLGFAVNVIVNALGYMVEGTNRSTVHMVNQYIIQRRYDESPGDYAVYVNIPRLAQYGWKIDAFIFYTK